MSEVSEDGDSARAFDVLVIEDDGVQARLIAAVLGDSDHEDFAVTSVSSLRDGLAHLTTKRADVVLLDLHLPDSSGLDTVRALRAERPDIPVVVLTGSMSEAAGLEALSIGVQEYLIKGDADLLNLHRVIRYAVHRKELQDAIEKHAEELARLNEDLAVLAHTLGHDLAQPLQTVLTYTEVTLEQHAVALGRDGRDGLGKALRAGRRMRDLMDTALRMASPRDLPRIIRPVRLGEVAEGVRENLRALLDLRNAVLLVETPEALVHADSRELTQVLMNLTSNGIKHNPRETPVVTVTCDMHAEGAEVAVTDNGEGLSPEWAERIFEPFVRGPEARGEGVGAGLSICKRLVERRGGQLWLDKSTEGATFRFTIPKPVDAS